jgi:hypothetical protein
MKPWSSGSYEDGITISQINSTIIDLTQGNGEFSDRHVM